MSFTYCKPTFTKLINEFALSAKGCALDLGSGKGLDACTLAEKGFEVDAVDKNTELLEAIKTKRPDVHLFNTMIEDFIIKTNKYSLITASYSLQFLTKESCKKVLISMISGTVGGGIIFFNLIGNKDEWANNVKWSTWKKEEIVDFLKDYPVQIRNFNEEDGIGDTMGKGLKHWHVYEIVLIKK